MPEMKAAKLVMVERNLTKSLAIRSESRSVHDPITPYEDLRNRRSSTLAQDPRIAYECRSRITLSREPSLTTVLEKLKALDAQRAQLLDDAKKEALENAEKAVAELNELGFHYSLIEGASTPSATPRAPRKAASQAPKRQTRDVPCPICHFKTTPHHDGRMHRSQKTKKPFSVEELMERHLAKVG
jgi:hypothetical protein